MKASTYFAALVVSCLFLGQATGLAVTRQDALVGWWNFDDNSSNDSSGNDYHGVHSSPSIYSTDSPFGVGKGIDLVGNQHVTVSDEGNQSTFDGGTQFTLSFWLKGWPDGAWEPIVSKRGESGQGWQVRRYGGENNKLSFTLRGPGYDDFSATPNLNDGQWHHVVTAWGGGKRTIFADGLQIASETRSGNVNPTGSQLVFGARDNSGNAGNAPNIGNHSGVKLDDIRFYDVPLTLQEVGQIYNNGQGDMTAQAEDNATVSGTINYSGPVTGPVVVWAKFNDQIVNTVTLPNGPGPYSMQLPMNRNYDIKAFRDGNENGTLDAGWQVGEPYAHHGDWNNTTSSFNTFLLDGNKTGIDVNFSWHNDHDNDGFLDWDEYVAGSEGNDSSSVPGIGYGLVAHWTFDETNGTVLGDSSGNDVNGTLVNFVSAPNLHWVPGKVGGALRLDGVDDYVSFPGATLLNDLAPITFAGWVMRESESDGGYLIAKRSTTTGYWRLHVGSSISWIRRFSGSQHPSYTSTSSTAQDQWTHLAFTWNGEANGANTQLYLDGVQTANPTRVDGSGTPVSDASNLFTIGNRPQNNTSYFKGKLDDFRIWNRALSATDVHTLFHAPGHPLTDANFTKAIDLWFSDQATATATYGHIKDWNVSQVTDMANAFQNRTTFNEDISGWDVSNVTDMTKMFASASAFNQPVGNWDVSKVTSMHHTFLMADSFNQEIGDWNTSSVLSMFGMFDEANTFNQDIGDWNTSAVQNMSVMFETALAFNQSIGNWNTGKVTNMQRMFQGATSFNQNISDWNTSSVLNMNYMFKSATAFNQDLSDWTTSADVNMTEIFFGTTSLSNTNKGLMHTSFKNNNYWPYEWSAFGVTLETGLVAWYPFDGNASDMSGNGNHGTVHGATLGADRHGQAGKAYSFDGTDDFIDVGDFEWGGALTISAWAKQDAFNSWSRIIDFGHGTGTHTDNVILANVESSSTAEFCFFLGQASNKVQLLPNNFWQIGQWTHAVATVDANGEMKLYRSGTLMGTQTATSLPRVVTRTHQFIGKSNWNTNNFIDGSIDDVRIYDRALSASEVEKLYHLERPGSPLTDANFTKAIDLWFSDQASAVATYGHISNWDVSGVTNMSEAFKDRTTFNEDISAWDVSSVTNMSHMFHGATAFNQPIGNWDVGNVKTMRNMFVFASNFNLPLTNWNVSSVTDLGGMFRSAQSFNQPIGNWNTSSATKLFGMFNGASSFNQPIGDWNVSSVTEMQNLFIGTISFNQSLEKWDVFAVTNMSLIFFNTPSLSNTNKGLIHSSFSSNSSWPYDWSAHVAAPPPDNNQTGDNNQTTPPPDHNDTNPPVDDNSTSPPPVHDHNQTHPVGDGNATAPPIVTQVYRPIVRTESVGQSTDGQPILEGIVLTDGGSPILESGFIMSRSIFFQPHVRLPAQTSTTSNEFSAHPSSLEPGKLYYFRAYAINAVGENFGSIKKFRAPEQSNAWWAQMPAVGAGWHNSEWFGTFRRHANTEWIYHAQLGWVYALSDKEDGLWLWSKEDGWLWTKPDVLPHLWKHRSGNWLYLMTTRNGKPVFHNYATGSVR